MPVCSNDEERRSVPIYFNGQIADAWIQNPKTAPIEMFDIPETKFIHFLSSVDDIILQRKLTDVYLKLKKGDMRKVLNTNAS